MKNGSLIVISLSATLMCAGFITACDHNEPPAPLVDNKQPNPITDRQRLVREFKTAEVFVLPANDALFIVRDTNGAVWFVNSDRSDGQHRAAGKTLVFPSTVPAPVMLPEEPDPELEKAKLAMQLLQLAFESYTNTHPVITNIAVEDPIKK